MLERILETALKDCQLTPGASVLVGVSGGPDSLCLLDALQHLGFQPIAAYFNHQLRAEAEDESRQVEALVVKMGVRFTAGRGDVAEAARLNGQSIEAVAREMRYRFLFSRAREFQAAAVAVGHNANDQAETVLMHILRGSGLDGLRGMPFRTVSAWDDRIPLVRPLLRCWREEIVSYCTAAGLQPVLDRSNLEPVYFRNRIRLNLMPEIERLAPGAQERIWKLSRLAEDELHWLDALEQQAWSNCVLEVTAGRVRFDLAAVRELAEPLQRRLIRHAAQTLRPTGEGMDFDNLKRAAAFIQSPRTDRKIELVQKLELSVHGKDLVLSARGHSANLTNYPQMEIQGQVPLEIPGRQTLGGGWEMTAEVCDLPDPEALAAPRDQLQLEAWMDADLLPETLEVRQPRAGDRFQPLGMHAGSQKLSDFWINRHIPAGARHAWPLVLSAGEIAWVPGFSPAERFRVRAETTRCVHLRVQRGER